MYTSLAVGRGSSALCSFEAVIERHGHQLVRVLIPLSHLFLYIYMMVWLSKGAPDTMQARLPRLLETSTGNKDSKDKPVDAPSTEHGPFIKSA
jgi:hypothetical protein